MWSRGKWVRSRQQHVPALACQHGSSRAATWSAANNHHIGTEIRSTQRCHPPISPVCARLISQARLVV